MGDVVMPGARRGIRGSLDKRALRDGATAIVLGDFGSCSLSFLPHQLGPVSLSLFWDEDSFGRVTLRSSFDLSLECDVVPPPPSATN